MAHNPSAASIRCPDCWNGKPIPCAVGCREWDPDRSYGRGGYTLNDEWRLVTYVLSGFDGITEGYVVMGLSEDVPDDE